MGSYDGAEVGFYIYIYILNNLSKITDQITYRPFKKPNDKLSYVHNSSNHPTPTPLCLLMQT